MLRFDAVADFDAAARPRPRRRAGVTPRGLVDCMVAAVRGPGCARCGTGVRVVA